MPTHADLRSRLYDHYVSGGRANAPESLAALASRAPYFERLIARHFPEDREASVFEVGCGYGALIHFARAAGYRGAHGVDLADEQVEAARRLGIEGVSQGDSVASLLALPEASQDVVVAFDVAEHFRKDELIGLVDAVHRALRPGGLWILHVPNGESPFVGSVLFGDLTHELAFTRDSLGQLVRASGFGSLRCFEDAPVVHGLKSAVRAVVWQLIRLALRVYVAAETGESGREAIFTRNLLAVVKK
jgi:SAM-dependent methyltransferase